MSESISQASAPEVAATGLPGGSARGAAAPPKRNEFIYYGLRNPKLLFGLTVEVLLVLAAIIAPFFARYAPLTTTNMVVQHPSSTFWLGTDLNGYDMYSQLTNGLRESYLIGALGAAFATMVGLVIGFLAGWRGGWLDEILQLITNVLVMIPSLVLLIVIGSYLTSRSILFEGTFIGLTTWPWVARAVRAQTFSLRSREYVDLARLSGKRPVSIVVKEIAPNMASYLFLVIILLFGSSMLIAASYDFLGLGPSQTVSLGYMMNQAASNSALFYHMWWVFIPPGAVLALMVFALLIANVGLDEVFNPKLREQ
jgi:peptide/nickel transport system permease protein